MSSHASREWITSGSPSRCARRIWQRNAVSCSSRRRVLVVEVEAGLADGDAPRRHDRERLRARPTRRPSREASWGCRPTVGHTSGWRSASSTAALRRLRGRCPRTPSPPPRRPGPGPRARRRPAQLARWQWRVDPSASASPSSGVGSMRGNSGAPFSSGEPAGRRPHAAASGRRWSSGRPGRPRRRHSSAAASGSPATRAARRCAAPRGSRRAPRRPRRASPALLSAHGLRVLDVRVGGADQLPHRAEAARVVELASSASVSPANASSAAAASGPSARASGTTPPQ